MKRFTYAAIIVLIVAAIAVYIGAYAIAEAPAQPEAPRYTYTIDLTRLIIAAIGIVMSYILTWIAKRIVPPVQAWLAAHTTHEQRETLARLTNEAVKAAEQIIKGPGRGEEKLRYVVDQLEARGYTADITTIEAAVKDMNDFHIADLFNIPTEPAAAEAAPTTESEPE